MTFLLCQDSCACRIGQLTTVFHCQSGDTTTAENTPQLLYCVLAPLPGSLALVTSMAQASFCWGSHHSCYLQNTGLMCFRNRSGSGLKKRFHSYMKLCLLRLIQLQDILTISQKIWVFRKNKDIILGTTLNPGCTFTSSSTKRTYLCSCCCCPAATQEQPLKVLPLVSYDS